MKTIKTFLFILMLSMCVNLSAKTAAAVPVKTNPLSEEIAGLLSNSGLIIAEDFIVKVFFSVSQEKTIQIRSISSKNEMVNQFLHKRLQGQQLKGSNWFTEKIYELPVRVQARK